MKIPVLETEREALYGDLVSECFASRSERKGRYDILKRWYLFGTGDQDKPTEYNKIYSHIDLLSSFLFSGETTSFVIEIPPVAGIDYMVETEKAKILTPRINETWHDSNIDLAFNDALIWALVLDSTFLKLVPLGKNQYMAYVIRPESMGVLREDIPTLANQEAICHEFFMTKSQITRMIKDWGQEQKDRILALIKPHDQERDQNTIPSGVQQIVINSTNPGTGEVSGEANTKLSPFHSYEAYVGEEGINCQELWVFDDDLKDYRKVLMIGGEAILVDSGCNTFVAGEVPFIKITPNPLDNYFWGKSELVPLIPLQEWINTRIPEIKKILAKLADPPVSSFGMPEAKLKALLIAGGIASNDDPVPGKVDLWYPKEVSDLFREFKMIEEMFDEVSGIRSILKGGGEPGVRAHGHADMLAKIGSTRPKKKAAILEDSVEKVATVILKMLRKYDGTHLLTAKTEASPKGIEFIAAQFTDQADVKVDAHSSSPIFIEQQIDNAMTLFQAGAADEEDLIDAIRPQNATALKVKLQKRLAEKKQMEALAATMGNQGAGKDAGKTAR